MLTKKDMQAFEDFLNNQEAIELLKQAEVFMTEDGRVGSKEWFTRFDKLMRGYEKE